MTEYLPENFPIRPNNPTRGSMLHFRFDIRQPTLWPTLIDTIRVHLPQKSVLFIELHNPGWDVLDMFLQRMVSEQLITPAQFQDLWDSHDRSPTRLSPNTVILHEDRVFLCWYDGQDSWIDLSRIRIGLTSEIQDPLRLDAEYAALYPDAKFKASELFIPPGEFRKQYRGVIRINDAAATPETASIPLFDPNKTGEITETARESMRRALEKIEFNATDMSLDEAKRRGFFAKKDTDSIMATVGTPPNPDVAHWQSDTEFPVTDWQYQVANGDTRLGYWDWVRSSRTMLAETKTKSE